MKSKSGVLLDRAVLAMVAAIEIHNKPGFPYRTESFAILAINGWELLLKAKWLTIHNNKIESLYERELRTNTRDQKSKKRYIKRTRWQTPRTLSLGYLVKKLVERKILHRNIWQNLDALIEFRDNATHFYNRNPHFASRLYEYGAACARNFAHVVQVWFGRELSEFDLHLMPLSFINPPSHASAYLLNAAEKGFLAFLDNIENQPSDPGSPFMVTLNVELKFTKSRADGAISVITTGDPSDLNVFMTDEDIRKRYPWDYAILTAECQQRYSNFKVNAKYRKERKRLSKDRRFGHLRRLDPDNSRSTTKVFYDPNILAEFDKLYTKETGQVPRNE